jgi:hypothetical protein
MDRYKVWGRRTLVCTHLVLTVLVGACGSGTEADQPVTNAPPASTPAATTPTISGDPATSIRSGTAYTFQPGVSDPNGDTLTFSINGKPGWAGFETKTGTLSGTPGAGDLGTFSNISITVSDGLMSAALAPFSILVSPAPSNSAALSWTPPTTDTDGGSISNLAGYKIYYGSSANTLTSVIQITNPGLTSYTVGNLNAGTYYFAVSAYTTDGIEGGQSAVVSKTMT